VRIRWTSPTANESSSIDVLSDQVFDGRGDPRAEHRGQLHAGIAAIDLRLSSPMADALASIVIISWAAVEMTCVH
jgi:hypothetical protein